MHFRPDFTLTLRLPKFSTLFITHTAGRWLIRLDPDSYWLMVLRNSTTVRVGRPAMEDTVKGVANQCTTEPACRRVALGVQCLTGKPDRFKHTGLNLI